MQVKKLGDTLVDENKNYLFTSEVYDGVLKGTCPGDSGGPLVFNQGNNTFCLLGTTVGGMLINFSPDPNAGNKASVREVCEGTAGGKNVDEKSLGYFNFVPEIQTKLQNSTTNL